MMKFNSLAFRLFISAAVWLLIVLPIAALVLIQLYQDSIEQEYDRQLTFYLIDLLGKTSGIEDGRVKLRAIPKDPAFETPFSGTYWQIKEIGESNSPQLSSDSLVSEILALPSEAGFAANEDLIRVAYVEGPKSEQLRIMEQEIRDGEGANQRRYSIAVAIDSSVIATSKAEFTRDLAIAFTILGFGLAAATFFQVQFGLRPLRAIGLGLAAIRSGKAERLEGDLPIEIKPLQKQLNALIKSNSDIVERARMHVGNLAHALKTPLSVISNEAQGQQSSLAKKVIEQAHIMRDQVTHHLERARMAAHSSVISGVTDVLPVFQALIRTLEKIHEHRPVTLKLECPQTAKFRGEKHDLEEMIGNLLDNACKWAASEVVLSARLLKGGDNENNGRLIILVDDDGPGLSEDERVKAVQRGRRLDESKPGSGLGLSIVADLSHLYNGTLELDESPKNGLRAKLVLPAA